MKSTKSAEKKEVKSKPQAARVSVKSSSKAAFATRAPAAHGKSSVKLSAKNAVKPISRPAAAPAAKSVVISSKGKLSRPAAAASKRAAKIAAAASRRKKPAPVEKAAAIQAIVPAPVDVVAAQDAASESVESVIAATMAAVIEAKAIEAEAAESCIETGEVVAETQAVESPVVEAAGEAVVEEPAATATPVVEAVSETVLEAAAAAETAAIKQTPVARESSPVIANVSDSASEGKPSGWTCGLSFDDNSVSLENCAAALVSAAQQGNLELVQSLLQRESEIVSLNEALMAAASAGHADIVAALAAAGADVNLQSTASHRCRPLHRAIQCAAETPSDCSQRFVQVVRALLLGGADVQARAAWCNVTPIVLAAMLGQDQFLHDLLPYCEAWDIYNASILGKSDIVAMILRRDNDAALAHEVNGMSALHYCAASRVGRNDPARAEKLARVAQQLIASGADVNASTDLGDGLGHPPIAWAAGNRAVADILLEHGADAVAGFAAAVREAEYLAADYFIQRGADIASAEVGRLVSDMARQGRGQPCKWLLERGASVNAPGKDGRTALHYACARGASDSFVEYLLSRGADANLRDDFGRTPIELVAARKKTRFSVLLRTQPGRSVAKAA